MVGADSVVKLIASTVFLAILVFVVAVGFTLIEPIFNTVISQSDLTALGWGNPATTLLLFTAMSLIALGVIVVLWWVVGWIREDVRQDIGRRF